MNTNADSLFDEELPHRAIEIEYNEIFPNLYENIVVLVDAQNAEHARDGISGSVVCHQHHWAWVGASRCRNPEGSAQAFAGH